jgi:hypothetical protein
MSELATVGIDLAKSVFQIHVVAELLRMGWFQPVHLKTPAARDLRLMLSARDSLARRMSLTTFSAGSLCVPDFRLIFAP